MKKFISFISLSILALSALLMPFSYAHAQGASSSTNKQINSLLQQAAKSPFGESEPRGPGAIVARIINVVLGFTGTITFIVFLYGGILWLTARGNDAQVDQAKTYIRNGVIGTIIVIAAFSLSIYITNAVFKAVI